MSDERRIARYEQRYGFVFRQHPEGSVTTTHQAIETGERERIK